MTYNQLVKNAPRSAFLPGNRLSLDRFAEKQAMVMCGAKPKFDESVSVRFYDDCTVVTVFPNENIRKTAEGWEVFCATPNGAEYVIVYDNDINVVSNSAPWQVQNLLV